MRTSPAFPHVETLELPGYLNLDQAAHELGIHPQSARRLIKAGQLPARLWMGTYLIERFALMQFKSSYDPRPGRKRLRRLL